MSTHLDVPHVRVAVEGESDTGMVGTLLDHVGLELASPCVVKRGVANLDKLIPGLAHTTILNPWIVFRDSDAQCPVEIREKLIGSRVHGDGFELRIACSMTEAWLLADTDGFAEFFKVPVKKLPQAPDSLPHAKQELLRVCQLAPNSIRKDMVHFDGSAGPLYVKRLNDFARDRWDVTCARLTSPSLDRTIVRLAQLLEELVETFRPAPAR